VNLLALSGPAGCGKNTLADLLPGYVQVSFAAPIKAMLAAVGVECDGDRSLRDEVLDGFGRTPRYLMQTLGTEWGRETVCENIWVNIAQKTCAECKRRRQDVVLTDLRFPNEATMVREMGGVVVGILRKSLPVSYLHSSEHQRVECDHYITNDGDPRDMLSQLEKLDSKN
jgi:hypothetical protein